MPPSTLQGLPDPTAIAHGWDPHHPYLSPIYQPFPLLPRAGEAQKSPAGRRLCYLKAHSNREAGVWGCPACAPEVGSRGACLCVHPSPITKLVVHRCKSPAAAFPSGLHLCIPMPHPACFLLPLPDQHLIEQHLCLGLAVVLTGKPALHSFPWHCSAAGTLELEISVLPTRRAWRCALHRDLPLHSTPCTPLRPLHSPCYPLLHHAGTESYI